MLKYELITFGIYGNYGSLVHITLEGEKATNIGIENYIRSKERLLLRPIHIGNNVYGNENQSDFLLNIEKNRSKNAPANVQTKHPIKELGIFTIKNIAKFIFYVLVAITAWYFTIYHPLFH